MEGGKVVTVEIPSKQWTLEVGVSDDEVNKFTLGVNGVQMSALPQAPNTVDS